MVMTVATGVTIVTSSRSGDIESGRTQPRDQGICGHWAHSRRVDSLVQSGRAPWHEEHAEEDHSERSGGLETPFDRPRVGPTQHVDTTF